MAFPAGLDDLSASRATSGTQKLSSPDHLTHHVNEDTAIQSLETKVGVDGSAVNTTLDYKLKSASSSNPGHVHTKAAISDLPTMPTGAVVGTTDTQTQTNKRITPRIGTVTNSATPTPDGDANDQFNITALAQAATIAAPTGTPVNGQKLIIRIKDNATAHNLSWNAAYVAGGAALPTTTVLSKIMTIGFIYNTDNSLNKWQCVAVVTES